MAVTLREDEKKQALQSIRRYCGEYLDLEMDAGDIKAEMLLAFFLKEIAPSIYNGAIADARAYLTDRVADMEGSCYEAEFSYWPKGSSVPRK